MSFDISALIEKLDALTSILKHFQVCQFRLWGMGVHISFMKQIKFNSIPSCQVSEVLIVLQNKGQ